MPLNTPSERRSPPRMIVLERGLDAWTATTRAHVLRATDEYRAVLTAWDKPTNTWKVCAHRA